MARLAEERPQEDVADDQPQRPLPLRQPDERREVRRGHQLHPLLRRSNQKLSMSQFIRLILTFFHFSVFMFFWPRLRLLPRAAQPNSLVSALTLNYLIIEDCKQPDSNPGPSTVLTCNFNLNHKLTDDCAKFFQEKT